MRRIDGVVQHYAWGDPETIPRLLGLEPDGRPWAELWLGTHPRGPARFDDGSLLESVSGPLPYLLKLLAAAEPLSLQTHPDARQAAAGHERGIFPDPFAKPELLCALTEFEALCGLRPAAATVTLLDELGASELAGVVAAEGPGAALRGLYRGAIGWQPVIEACADDARPEARWVRVLAERYPADPSVAATLLLNRVELAPGEALRLDAGNLHAYLHGAGIELMGASDNVVRGGLTIKEVDVDELLRTVDTEPLADPVLPTGERYELPAAGVALQRIDVGAEHRARGHELAIDLAGGTWYVAPGTTIAAAATTFVVTPM